MEMALERCGFRAAGNYALIRLAREAGLDMLGPTERADPINPYARHRTRQRAKSKASHRGTRNPQLGEGGMPAVGRASRRFKGGIGIALVEGGWHDRHKHGRAPAAIGTISKRRALVLQGEGGKKESRLQWRWSDAANCLMCGAGMGGSRRTAQREKREEALSHSRKEEERQMSCMLITCGCSGDRDTFLNPVFGMPDGAVRYCPRSLSPVAGPEWADTRCGLGPRRRPGRVRSRRTS